MKFRTLLLASALFIFIMGIGSPASAGPPWSTVPSWMPMEMLYISYDAGTNKLAITTPIDVAVLGTNTDGMGAPAPGIADFDPSQPTSVLINTVFSRKLGWDDRFKGTANAIMPSIQAVYGPGARMWIQGLVQSPGLNTYQAIGQYGLDMGNSYPGIFGTGGSSTKWQWDGMMDHNTYAVPFSSITKPNQIFSAYYKIYIGDSLGNDISPSASTTTTWVWQGPPFVFTSQTGVATGILVESDVYTHTGTSGSISITGGDYAISTDGGSTWGAWFTPTSPAGTINTNDKVKVRQTSSASPGTTTTATLAIPTAYGPGSFRLTTLGPVTTPTAFSFSSQTGVALSTFIESSVITVAGINAPAAISISAGGEYAVSTDGGTTWGAWATTAGTVANNNRVKVRQVSSSNEGVTTSTTLTIGGVTGKFVVTTGTSVTPSLSFTPVTNAPANTSVSGMPFYVTSNAITVAADSTISVAGGITPDYQVSTNGGVTWSAASNTTPATVAAGNLVRVRVVPATTPFNTSVTNLILGSTVASFSVTTGYMNPPSWMPMAMLNVAFNSSTNTLSVQNLNTHPSFPGTTLPALTYVPAGSYDPTKPWSAINGGVAISRQLGWDDNTALHGSGITVPGSLPYQVQAAYPGGSIWIELISKSAGLETYFADGMFGVGGTSSGALSGTPQPYSNSTTGFPIIYANNYYGIFGTDGSSTKWKWDGTMIHNVYAVPAAFITQPNQVFTATYRVYIGDASGIDIAPAAATTAVWSWKAPAALPAQAAQPAYLNIQTFNAQKTSVYLISAPSATSGALYNFQYSTDGVNWTAIGTPSATRNPTFTLPAGPGSYQFRVFVTAPGFRESLFATTSGSVVLDAPAASPAYLNIQKFNAAVPSVYLIAAPSSTPGAVYNFQYRLNGGIWTAIGTPSATRNPTFTLPAGPGSYEFQVYVTAPGGFTASVPTPTVGSVTVAAQAPAPAYLNVQSFNATTGKAYLISAPSAIPGALYTFQYRLVGAPTWTDFSVASTIRNPTITVGAGETEFQVIITAPGYSASTPKAANTTVSVATVPGAPTVVKVAAGVTVGTTASVSFSAPASNGGSAITGYTVTVTPGSITATGPASPIAIAGLTPGTDYTFSVVATNSLGNSTPASAKNINNYDIVETFLEPMTQPNDSIFIGTFTYDSITQQVSNLQGILSESMTGGATGYPNDTMTWLPLANQLSSVYEPTLGGLLVTTFKNSNTNTFFGGSGWTPADGIAAGGVYYGFPTPANNPGNAYAMIFVNATDPTAPLTQAQFDKLAYADCAPGGMMGAVCMTGTTVAGYGALGTMSGYPVSQVITIKP